MSCETIYAFIYRAAQWAEQLWRYLTRRHKRRRPRRSRSSQDTIKDRVSIHARPKTVDGRTEGGHWEGDLIICKRTRPVLVLHERKSRVTLAARLAGKTAAETISVMLAVFARIEPALRKSITFDNNTAFAQHALLRTMRAMTTWFCDAYASWQKGGVEKRPTVDYAAGCLVRSTSTKCPTKKSRTSSSPPTSRRENAWASRPLSKRSSKSLAKTCKSGSHNPRIQGVKAIPIVFTSGGDPVVSGVVRSLACPEGITTVKLRPPSPMASTPRVSCVPLTAKQPECCPYCGSHVLARRGTRKKKLKIVQLWHCSDSDLTEDIDPPGEHDSGRFKLNGVLLL